MLNTNAKISEVVIREPRDAWEVLFNYEIHDVFGDILDFFLQHRNPRDFEELCRALDIEQLREIFRYFLDNYDEAKVIFFFEALDIGQKEYFLEHLIFNVTEEQGFAQESSVIRVRKDFFSRKAIPLKDLKSAVREASAYNYLPVARYLQSQPDKMRQFIGELEKHHLESFKEIIGGFVLELFSYLPHKSGDYAEDNETAPFENLISV